MYSYEPSRLARVRSRKAETDQRYPQLRVSSAIVQCFSNNQQHLYDLYPFLIRLSTICAIRAATFTLHFDTDTIMCDARQPASPVRSSLSHGLQSERSGRTILPLQNGLNFTPQHELLAHAILPTEHPVYCSASWMRNILPLGWEVSHVPHVPCHVSPVPPAGLLMCGSFLSSLLEPVLCCAEFRVLHKEMSVCNVPVFCFASIKIVPVLRSALHSRTSVAYICLKMCIRCCVSNILQHALTPRSSLALLVFSNIELAWNFALWNLIRKSEIVVTLPQGSHGHRMYMTVPLVFKVGTPRR